MELETLIVIVKNLNYITNDQYESLNNKINETGKILQGLIKSLNQKVLNN
jgi:four helix bundle protein